jgi:hypothetical protein
MHKALFRREITLLGIDKAISFTLAGRLAQAIGSLGSLVLISRYLTANEQGYFYTFGSILAIQVFFELGLTSIITQYVAHEKAMLKWNGNILFGSEESLSRLSSILRLTIKWYTSIAVLLLILLTVIGFIFFENFSQPSIFVEWKLPWVLLVISTSSLLLMTAVLAFYEGLEKAKECAKIRMFQQLIQITALVVVLILGAKLYSTGIAMLFSSLFVILWVSFSKITDTLKFIWNSQNSAFTIDWKGEVLPYQWRIAVSWMSGYFIFQLFNPILFATQGAIVAGQMGMTMAVIQGVCSFANAWLKTKVPTFSVLIARQKYTELDIYFKTATKQASLVLLGLLLLLTVIFLALYQLELPIINRFLPFIPVMLLMGASILQLLIDAMATYLRCHKREPFLILSVAIGFATSLMIYTVSTTYGVTGVTIGYFMILLAATVWGHQIFNKRKLEWHEQ